MSDEITDNEEFSNETIVLSDDELKAIMEYFNVESDDVIDGDYDHYGLNTLEIEGLTYALAHDYDEAEIAATEQIKQGFDEYPSAFSAWVLCDNMPNEISSESVEDLIKNELNEVIKELVNIDGLVSDCIGYDGVGQSLAGYDGEKIEIEVDNDFIYLFRVE